MDKINDTTDLQEGSNIKVRLAYGDLTLEYEGSRQHLGEVLKEILGFIASAAEYEIHLPDKSVQAQDKPKSEKADIQLGSVTEYAKRLGVKTGPDLIRAAAAYLTFEKSKDRFNRDELREAAKDASGYWKDSYSSNLTKYLETMVKKDVLRDTGSNYFSLSQNEREKIHSTLLHSVTTK